MSPNESHVEEATLTWFGELGYALGHGPDLALGESVAERESFADVVLIARLRDAITRLSPTIPEDAREEALRKVTRGVEYYNLDVIIAVAYRVNSYQATQFRIWATQTLREFIIKGFVMDDERLKDLPGRLQFGHLRVSMPRYASISA